MQCIFKSIALPHLLVCVHKPVTIRFSIHTYAHLNILFSFSTIVNKNLLHYHATFVYHFCVYPYKLVNIWLQWCATLVCCCNKRLAFCEFYAGACRRM